MTAPQQYTIGRLAERAGVSVSTIRYYERIGLIEPESRSTGNYRLYSQASVKKLRFIRAAQAVGFTLDDTRALLADETGEPPRCGSVQKRIEARLADVEQRLKDLRHVRGVLRAALDQCSAQSPSERCCIVEKLRAAS